LTKVGVERVLWEYIVRVLSKHYIEDVIKTFPLVEVNDSTDEENVRRNRFPILQQSPMSEGIHLNRIDQNADIVEAKWKTTQDTPRTRHGNYCGTKLERAAGSTRNIGRSACPHSVAGWNAELA